MQRRTEIIIGAAATALTAASPMLATPATAQPIPAAVSYADLLEPVPNAMERLTEADDAARGNAHLIPAQYQVDGPQRHDHHHHHHHHSRSWYRANGYVWNGGTWVRRPIHHHHHHHHHHSNY